MTTTKENNNLVARIPRLGGRAGKFLPGICRWMDEMGPALHTDAACERLDILLHILKDHPIAFDFFDADFNGQSLAFVESSLHMEPGNRKEEVWHTPEHVCYKAVKIRSYKDTLPYAQYAPDWCIILSENAYNGYTQGGLDTFWFLERSDMATVPRIPGAAFPRDDYGLSLLAVCVSAQRRIVSVTSRWNYGDDGDHLLSTKELASIVGEDVIQKMTDGDL